MKLLKTLLLWLLLLVTPLQGLAGNAMAICQPMHQRVNQAVMTDHASQHSGAIQHDAGHHHHHAHHDARGEPVMHESGGTPDQQLSTCSMCAACSISALWIAGGNTVLPVFITPSTTISYLAFHVPGVDPERPEHPPRSVLA